MLGIKKSAVQCALSFSKAQAGLLDAELLLRQGDGFLEDLKTFVDLGLLDAQGRGDADDALAATQHEQAALEGQFHHPVA